MRTVSVLAPTDTLETVRVRRDDIDSVFGPGIGKQRDLPGTVQRNLLFDNYAEFIAQASEIFDRKIVPVRRFIPIERKIARLG